MLPFAIPPVITAAFGALGAAALARVLVREWRRIFSRHMTHDAMKESAGNMPAILWTFTKPRNLRRTIPRGRGTKPLPSNPSLTLKPNEPRERYSR
ncbi:MAG: hypothetical protein ACXWU0_05865 [Rhodoplanes sp.]